MSRKLLFIVNVDWAFVLFRLPIALEAMRQGFDVHVAAGMTDKKEAMEKMGLNVHPLSLTRGRACLADTAKSFFQILGLFRKLKPDIVHLVTIKPVLFGGIAARMARVPAVVAAVSGLGFIFIAQGALAQARRIIVLFLYRLALGGERIHVIFQNPDDRDSLIQGAGVSKSRTVLIRGSGVDLELFSYTPLPKGVPVVVLAARLLTDKGVREFAEAARILKQKGSLARFCLVGTTDPENPATLSDIEVQAWVREGTVEAWGHRDDMPQVLRAATLVVLPSYREGLPKILLEAAASGRAVVTTDVPGCRDAIESGITGILVPAKDASSLAKAIKQLLDDSRRCEEMGKAGRALAEASFNIGRVVSEHIALYNQLLSLAGK